MRVGKVKITKNISKLGYFDLYAIQAPPLLNFGASPEIGFFNFSDDLDQKKKNFGLVKFFKKVKKNFFLENVRKLPRRVRNVQKLPRRVRKRPETAPQG